MSYEDTMRFLRTGYSGRIGGADGPSYLCDTICTMRAAYLTYRNAHWQVQGPEFYGNHQMFERLYDESKDSIDTLAEQIVGTYGPDGIREDAEIISERVTAFAQPRAPVANALLAAMTIQQKLASAYSQMQQEGVLTPGWDDVLQSIAAVNDKHIYMLRQTQGTPVAGRAHRTRRRR